jgi:hypothetical protein
MNPPVRFSSLCCHRRDSLNWQSGEDEKILTVREPGQFTGEMSVISGSRFASYGAGDKR